MSPPLTPQDYLSAHFPEVRSTLRPGASVEDIKKLEEELGFTLPPALRILYRSGRCVECDVWTGVPAKFGKAKPNILTSALGEEHFDIYK